MNAFDKHGHLTEEALRVLTDGGSLTELERLELAEHLSYCDGCLERYAALLAETPLMEPPPRCKENIRRRIRRRAAGLLLNRCTAAAAAVAVVVTAVWTAPAASVPHSGGERPVIGEVLRSWPERLDRRLEQITGLWAGRDNIQGGHTS